MATLKEIRRRISSIKSTEQITKAMKMVAASKLRRAQQKMLAARPYAHKIEELIQSLLQSVEDFESPLIEIRPTQRVHLIAVTADRGLCGSFNSNIIKKTLAEVDSLGNVEVVINPVGKKANDFFKKRNFNLGKVYIDIFNDLRFNFSEDIIRFVTKEFIDKKTDQVKIIYNEFKSVVQQHIIVEDLLPIKVENFKERAYRNFIYEPSQAEILHQILPKHLNIQMWKALLESNAAEQGARMTAMENATENANEIIHDLTLQYNKARQASITKELIEIVSGAEALSA